jgi:hypothetical protein
MGLRGQFLQGHLGAFERVSLGAKGRIAQAGLRGTRVRPSTETIATRTETIATRAGVAPRAIAKAGIASGARCITTTSAFATGSAVFAVAPFAGARRR